ncbi:PA2817 family protein [Pseudomaricurvus sp.]|uniref:PA2817 family protein n=1 Tax=Pseudomaricurvus sp. TaxID=2004510 RepID=UPI003F6B68F9
MKNQYVQFHRNLLQALQQAAAQAMPVNELSEEDQTLLSQLDLLANSKAFDETFIATGQQALCRIVAAYPNLAPQVSRDLFWLFGGDCLHYMPDEEISLYQQLDELRFEAENDNTDFDYEKQRARILGLH